MTPAVRRALLWAPVIAYMAVIFALSAQSNPPAPSDVPDWVLHGVEYFGFTVLVVRALSGGLPARLTGARIVSTMAIVVVFAISDEVHQLFVPSRTADIRDVRADVIGASLALLACWAWLIIATPSSGPSTPVSHR